MKKGRYNVAELVDSIIEEYQLPTDGEDAWGTYRQKVYRTLKSTGIWDKGIKKNGWEKDNHVLYIPTTPSTPLRKKLL